MSLTILNNISSLSAENALSNTQANLQKTLTQLSTGLRDQLRLRRCCRLVDRHRNAGQHRCPHAVPAERQ